MYRSMLSSFGGILFCIPLVQKYRHRCPQAWTIHYKWRFTDGHIIWLVVWNMKFIFPYTGYVIIPTDFHSIIFQRGRAKKQPTSHLWGTSNCHVCRGVIHHGATISEWLLGQGATCFKPAQHFRSKIVSGHLT